MIRFPQLSRRQFIFLVGLLFIGRFFLSFTDRHSDVYYFSRWVDIYRQQPVAYYELDFSAYDVVPANYPPLALLLLIGTEQLYRLLIPAFMFLDVVPYRHDFFKLPSLFFDVGMILVLYRYLRYMHVSLYHTYSLCLLYFVHPLNVFISTMWGQTDMIPLFFIILGLWFILQKKRLSLVTLALCASLLLKQTSVVFLAVLGFVVLFQYPFKAVVRSIVITMFVLYISFVPFLPSHFPIYNPLHYYQEHILSVSGLPFTSNNAFTMWYVLHGNRQQIADDPVLWGVSYTYISYFLVGCVLLFCCYFICLRRFSQKSILVSLFIMAIFSFILLVKMHERHLVLALPILFLLYPYFNKRLYWFYFLLYTIYGIWNVYISWHPKYMPALPEILIASETNILAICIFIGSTLLFVWNGVRKSI